MCKRARVRQLRAPAQNRLTWSRAVDMPTTRAQQQQQHRQQTRATRVVVRALVIYSRTPHKRACLASTSDSLTGCHRALRRVERRVFVFVVHARAHFYMPRKKMPTLCAAFFVMHNEFV